MSMLRPRTRLPARPFPEVGKRMQLASLDSMTRPAVSKTTVPGSPATITREIRLPVLLVTPLLANASGPNGVGVRPRKPVKVVVNVKIGNSGLPVTIPEIANVASVFAEPCQEITLTVTTKTVKTGRAKDVSLRPLPVRRNVYPKAMNGNSGLNPRLNAMPMESVVTKTINGKQPQRTLRNAPNARVNQSLSIDGTAEFGKMVQ